MNEYNHHRIISRVVAQLKTELQLSDTDADILENTFRDASDYSDVARPDKAKAYYFYLYYYNIDVSGNKIKLNRVVDNGLTNRTSISTMDSCGEKLFKEKLFSEDKKTEFSLQGWSSLTNEKEFFSSVNGRGKSRVLDIPDLANQSDNVAFLHAMGAEDENESDAEDTFKKHLKKCFTEYLFLENEHDALKMLGIAMHGIMDSFTPSHMGFQQYSKQDHDFHAQGDVIPIKGVFDKKNGKLISYNSDDYEPIYFDPGQDEKVGINNDVLRTLKLIHFNGDDVFISLVEYYMLRIFFHIGKLGRWKDNKIQSLHKDEIESFWEELKKGNNNKKTINDILLYGRYCYGEGSYIYSEKAISVIVDIYKDLYNNRKDLFNKSKADRYNYYKSIKNTSVLGAVKKWEDKYKELEKVREEHKLLDLYSEKKEVIDDRNRRSVEEMMAISMAFAY